MTDPGRIDFGTVGLPGGTEIVFTQTGETHCVGSGIGVPGNGGSLIRVTGDNSEYTTILGMTRRLLGGEFSGDPWALWEYGGETLRDRYKRRQRQDRGDILAWARTK